MRKKTMKSSLNIVVDGKRTFKWKGGREDFMMSRVSSSLNRHLNWFYKIYIFIIVIDCEAHRIDWSPGRMMASQPVSWTTLIELIVTIMLWVELMFFDLKEHIRALILA